MAKRVITITNSSGHISASSSLIGYELERDATELAFTGLPTTGIVAANFEIKGQDPQVYILSTLNGAATFTVPSTFVRNSGYLYMSLAFQTVDGQELQRTNALTFQVQQTVALSSITKDEEPYFIPVFGHVIVDDQGSPVIQRQKLKFQNAVLDQVDDDMTVVVGAIGADGISPTATVAKAGDTATITMTDVNGTTTAQIKDGRTPVKGTDYKDGADGVSPTVAVSKVGNKATVTINDRNGVKTFDVLDGDKGANGVSPTVTSSKLGKTTTISITDANGTTEAHVNDGADGQNGVSPTATVNKVGNLTTLTVTDKNGTTTATIQDGLKGADGNILFATFDVDTATGNVVVTLPDGYNGATFSVNDQGYMEVTI